MDEGNHQCQIKRTGIKVETVYLSYDQAGTYPVWKQRAMPAEQSASILHQVYLLLDYRIEADQSSDAGKKCIDTAHYHLEMAGKIEGICRCDPTDALWVSIMGELIFNTT